VREVAEDPETRTVSASAMAKAIDHNTIFMIGSCPQYPHGAVDPIPALAAVARSAGIGMHVDCCLGSFVVPFMRDAGFDEFIGVSRKVASGPFRGLRKAGYREGGT